MPAPGCAASPAATAGVDGPVLGAPVLEHGDERAHEVDDGTDVVRDDRDHVAEPRAGTTAGERDQAVVVVQLLDHGARPGGDGPVPVDERRLVLGERLGA